MSTGANDLKKANKLYLRGKYGQVLQLLEAQIFRYRQSFRFYYILGMSCIRTGDISGAASYLQRALSIRPGQVNALLGMALVHLKQQKTADSIKDWFEVLDQDPKNKYARRGLDAVRKHGNPDDLLSYIESKKIFSLLPRERSISPLLPLGGFVVLLLAAGVLLFPLYKDFLPKRQGAAQRSEISQLQLEVENYSSEPEAESQSRYDLEEGEIKSLYQEVIDHFHRFEDNQARMKINRLLLSNASAEVKNKLQLLEDYVREPSFESLKKSYPFSEVRKDPPLYDQCYVLWRGKVGNLQVGDEEIRFDLLVGYHRGEVLEGVVPTSLDFAARIDPSLPIEVLGRVTVQGERISLRGVTIHQFIPESN
ncbi:MAG TPA: tetratricopeptide repeat protein [Sediminispirochaeta sp.]|nr:tetratricopeptide repeat protein [Sediminispirochaeta sp.]